MRAFVRGGEFLSLNSMLFKSMNHNDLSNEIDSSFDLNQTFKDWKITSGSVPKNAPHDVNPYAKYGNLFLDDSTVLQFAFDVNNIFVRSNLSNIWRPWKKIQLVNN